MRTGAAYARPFNARSNGVSSGLLAITTRSISTTMPAWKKTDDKNDGEEPEEQPDAADNENIGKERSSKKSSLKEKIRREQSFSGTHDKPYMEKEDLLDRKDEKSKSKGMKSKIQTVDRVMSILEGEEEEDLDLETFMEDLDDAVSDSGAVDLEIDDGEEGLESEVAEELEQEAPRDMSEYEEDLDSFLIEFNNVVAKTKPSDDFLRKADPTLFYKRKVNEMWQSKKCYFCNTDHMSDLHFMNIPLLTFFISEAGNIYPRRVSHLCSRHQRKLARTIKHARHTGLLPFRGNLSGRFPLYAPEDKDATANESFFGSNESKGSGSRKNRAK